MEDQIMAELIINQQIASLRKQKGITQEELAGVLGVTNQTVSKWELAACCPDIQLLPDIADYFNVSIDELFFGINAKETTVDSVPWDDDDTIRAVVFIGKKIMEKTDDLSNFKFIYEGEARNVESQIDIQCGDISGNANAGCDINCGIINSDVNAGCDVCCADIHGNVNAGCDVNCMNIDGDVSAGCDINCLTINGSARAGQNITRSS